MRLPNGYQEVEWIQSSGTQYIDTGYIPNNNTKIKCTIGGWNTGTGQYGTMFGVRLERSESGRGFMLDYDSTNSRVLYMFGGGYNPNVGFSFPSGGKHTIEFGSGGVYEDGTLRFTPSSATFTSPANLTLFALNNNGTVGEFGGFKLYSCKIIVDGTLVRDFVPCYRKSDNIVGLYDLVDGQFYTNAGSGTFTKGFNIHGYEIQNIYMRKNEPILPSGYQEVEYIQSSGTQCINTGFNVTKNSKIFADIQFTSTTVQQRVFGVDNGNDGVSMASYINGSGKYSRYIGNGGGSFTFQATTITADTNRHTFTLDNSRYIITTGGNEVSNTVNSQTITNNPTNNQLAILAQYGPTEDDYYNYASAKLYACKIWDNGILVRDFIPCYRKSDNEIGLYDLVNNQFYTNSGTGSFTKGDDVPTYKEFLVRPSKPTEITETYTRAPFQSPVSIYKSGYKIKQAIMEWEGKYTGSNWYITEPKINSSSVVFSCVMSVGGSYGYNYGDGQGRYGGIRMQVSGTYTGIVSVNSGATTSSQNAGRVIITPEVIEYHIGKTFGSWLQEGTATPSSTINGNITTLFNSNDVTINGACWNSSTSTFNFYRCIITYEPI